MFLTIWEIVKPKPSFINLPNYFPGWYPTFPLLPLPPSWSSHCQSTPLTTRPPVKIPLAVIFFDLRRDSKSTLLRFKEQKNKKTFTHRNNWFHLGQALITGKKLHKVCTELSLTKRTDIKKKKSEDYYWKTHQNTSKNQYKIKLLLIFISQWIVFSVKYSFQCQYNFLK